MIDDEALRLLRILTANPAAAFHDGQLEAIRALVDRRSKALVVQRTGWGKSAVYFIATRLLRDRGFGPTVLISPLLALMRNQIVMAERAGVRAATINSENRDDWKGIEANIASGDVDLLLISPERLNNARFRAQVLPDLLGAVGLLVVDEAHCISDWGHDFRPDYRRLARVLPELPSGSPVLCTTATANDRVVDDIIDQLGDDLEVIRGPLDRESLALAVLDLPQPADRLAWLARQIPQLAGSGIVYCLTIGDTERVAGWLRTQGIDARAYSGDSDAADRPAIEDALLANEVKVVVATSALGMGFDKPDLSFVIHYQSPGSPIAYYQQVGRAGRGVASAHGILLRGNEDADIQDYFIRTAFPPQDQAEAIVGLLEERGSPVSIWDIEAAVNARHSRVEAMLKVLEVEGAVERAEGGWQRTTSTWSYPSERIAKVTALRRTEQQAMNDYARTAGCRMAFVRAQLDDPEAGACGRCDNCRAEPLPAAVDPALVAEAQRHLRSQALTIEPRKRWPYGLGEPKGNIAKDEQLRPGRVLAIDGDGGWGSVVRSYRARAEPLPDEVIEACIRLVGAAAPDVGWATSIPSVGNGAVLEDAARRIAGGLGVPYTEAIRRRRPAKPQREMENSAQQVSNVYRAFSVTTEMSAGPVLLIDDLIDSGWTMTVAGLALRVGGSGPVFPFALVKGR